MTPQRIRRSAVILMALTTALALVAALTEHVVALGLLVVCLVVQMTCVLVLRGLR
jgi:hypothetical protein